MGSVYRKAWTAPVPEGAEVVDSKAGLVARWRIRGGKVRSAEAFVGDDGVRRIRGKTAAYYARYKDTTGRWVEVATDCRDESAARAVLQRLERRVERVRSGIVTPDEDAAATHGNDPVSSHVEPWVRHLELKQASPRWIRDAVARIDRVCREAGLRRLRDVNAGAFERWLSDAARSGLSAATRNAYRTTFVAFLNWCVRDRRLVANPLVTVATANPKTDRRRERRALTEAELERLLDAARRRPLIDALTIRRGAKRGERAARVGDEVRARLERLGHERALIYKTLLLTGLRKSELASLTVGQAELDAPAPHLRLDARDEKNHRGATLPLREDLATELREWIRTRLAEAKDAARARKVAVPEALPATEPLFDVPRGLIRIFDRDLVFAGIAKVERRQGRDVVVKRDEYGRSIDVHALRHTFGTYLSKGGVSLRTAQAAMRHSDPSLTANVYTDTTMLDVAGALEALPKLAVRAAANGG